MRKYRCTITLALAAAIAAILLYFVKDINGFPARIMVIFWPADYVWRYLCIEVGRGYIRTVLGNIGFFSILAGLQGALVGFLLDSFFIYRVSSLVRRIKGMSYSKDPLDSAFRRRVLEILVEYDPAGLLTITTDKQTYKPTSELILKNLKRFDRVKDLRKFCQKQFQRDFGREALRDFDRYEALAADIWTGYKQVRSSPRQVPPSSHGL